MKTYIAYKEESDHARAVIDFLRDFERRTNKQLKIVNPETAAGDATCRVYDIVEYPTIFATDDNGVLQTTWRGLPLPTIDEVSYYVQ